MSKDRVINAPINITIDGRDQIAKAKEETRQYAMQVEALQEQLNSANATLDGLNERLREIENSDAQQALRQFARTAEQSVGELRSYLQSVHLDPDDWRFDELIESVRAGQRTAGDAITRIKMDWEDLIRTVSDGSAEGLMGGIMQQLAATLDTVVSKLDKLIDDVTTIQTQGVKTIADAAQGAGTELTDSLRNVGAAAAESGQQAAGSYEEIAKLVESLRSFDTVNSDKMGQIATTFRSLSNIVNGQVNTKTTQNLADLITKLSMLGGNGVVRFDFAGLEGLKSITGLSVRKTSLENIVKYIPEITKLNLNRLKTFADIKYDNINNLKVSKSAIDQIERLTAAIRVLQETRAATVRADESSIDVVDDATALRIKVYNDATKAIREYMTAVKQSANIQGLEAPTSLMDDSSESGIREAWAARSEGAVAYASKLNSLRATLQQMVSDEKMELLTDNERQEILRLLTKTEQDYAIAIEKVGAAERSRTDKQQDIEYYRELSAAIQRYNQLMQEAVKNENIAGPDKGSALGTWTAGENATANDKLLVDSLNAQAEAIRNITGAKQDDAKTTQVLSDLETHYKDTVEKAARAQEQRAAKSKEAQAANEKAAKSLADYEKIARQYAKAGISRNADSREAYSKLQEAANKLNTAYANGKGDTEAIKKAQEEYNQVLQESRAVFIRNGDDVKTMGDRIKDAARNLGIYISTAMLMRTAFRYFKQMVSNAIELDSAFAQLRIITHATDAEMAQFASTSAILAQNLGKSIIDVTKSIEVFSRLGYNLQDASKLAEYATILSNVADVDASAATTGLTSIIKGFNLNVEDASHVADVLVEVGQKYAVSAAEMMEAYEKSGAALNATNTSLEKSAGLIAAGNAAVQNSAVIGTALKTVAARIRGSKTDLEELGEGVEDLAEGFSKYAKEIKALTGFDIMLDASKGTFKDLYDIFDGIAKVWDKLSDTQRARVSEILGGTRQLQVISSIINNWEDAANAYSTAMNSAGAATKANEIYMETAAAHIERFKAAFQELSRTLIDTGLVSTIVDFGAGVLSAIGSVASFISKLGGLKTILAAVGAYLLIAKAETIAFYIELAKEVILKRVIVLFDGIKSGFKSLIQIIPNAVMAWKNYAAGTAAAGATMEATIPVLGLVLAAVTAVIAGVSAANQAADEANQKAKEAADQAAASSKEISKLVIAYTSANEAYRSGSIDIAQYNDAKRALIDKLIEEGGLVDQLTGKYNQNTEALNKNIEATLKKQSIDISAGKAAALEELKSVANGAVNYNPLWGTPWLERINPNHFAYDTQERWGIDKEEQQALASAYKALYEAGFVNDKTIYDSAMARGEMPGYRFVLDFDFDLDTVEGATAAYKNLEKILSVLKDAHLDESEVFKQLYKQYDNLGEKLNKYNSYIAESNENLVAQKMANSLVGKDLPKTADEFEQLRDKIITATRVSGEFIGSEEQLINVVDEFLNTQPEFEEFYKKTDSGTATISSLESALQKSKEASKGLADSLSKTNANYSLLEKAQKEISENGGLSADTIKSLADANENYLDYLYEENGQIKLNTDAWREFAELQMTTQITELKGAQEQLKEEREVLKTKIAQAEATLAAHPDSWDAHQLLSESSRRLEEINNALTENESILLFYETVFNNLTSSTEEVVSYLTSLGYVVNSFEDVANAIKGVNDQYKSLAELQVAVSDGFRMSQEEALKYAEIYPEILSGATLAANGEIQLNENVVNNFIAGKKAELSASIDAQIQRLETRKGVLKAIQDYAIAELEIAQKVASGEALTDKQLSELRAKNKNALTEALIGLNVEEVDANKIAAEAMAGNYGEVDRIEAEVAKNMAENMGKAANDMAVSMHNNMHNAKLDIRSVGQQAFIAAKAIDHMKRGVVVDEDGNPVLVSGSSGGAGWSASSSTVSGGTFHGGENIYHEILPELDDYIKGLSDQINSYQDAIDNIDGQIKLLESIKAHAFEIFRKQAEEAAKNKDGKSGSGKNSSSGSDKGDNWFEAQYKLYQHLLNMDAAETEDYLHWLEWAYQEAYNQGIITLDEYFKYQEEVFKGLRDLFKDYLSDLEHQISMRENFDGETDEILNIYEELLAAVTAEIHRAQEQGLDDNDDWLQELQDQYWKYFNAIKDLREDVTKNAKDSVEELVQIRIKMLKQEIQKEKDAIKERLDALKKFYQKQKDMLQEQYDEEKYLREQSEKRKDVQDIMSELAQLEFDNSAWAEKRKLELRQKLAEAQQALDDFERDHALETAKDELDKLYEMQEEELEKENELLEEKENDAKALYEQALEDIKNGSIELYEEMIRWNEEYGDGIEDTIKDAWESAYKALKEYMDLYGEYYKGIHLGNATGYQDDGSWDDHFAHTPAGSGAGTSSNAPSAGDTSTPSSSTPSSSTPSSSSPSSSSYPYGKASETTGIIKKGSEGTDVKAIQYALKKLGYKDGNGKVLVVDGKFGAKTEAAVKKFQKKMGLDPNGKVGDKTRKKFKKKGYYTGTSFASPGLHPFEEFGTETTFESNDGTRYKMFTGGEKVLTAKQSDFLYKFATNGARVLEQFMQALTSKGMPNVGQPINHYEIRMGDITINGSANQETVSQMRRAQRESVDFMLKELNKLNAR